jgi:hypothetical protein
LHEPCSCSGESAGNRGLVESLCREHHLSTSQDFPAGRATNLRGQYAAFFFLICQGLFRWCNADRKVDAQAAETSQNGAAPLQDPAHTSSSRSSNGEGGKQNPAEVKQQSQQKPFADQVIQMVSLLTRGQYTPGLFLTLLLDLTQTLMGRREADLCCRKGGKEL